MTDRVKGLLHYKSIDSRFHSGSENGKCWKHRTILCNSSFENRSEKVNHRNHIP